jgi:hypothetical protein
LPQAYFEVRVPAATGLDHIELSTHRPATRGVRVDSVHLDTRIDHATLDRILVTSKQRLAARAAASGSTLLYESGPSSNRMDIVLIGDGYAAGDTSKWTADAQKVASGLLGDPLFGGHKAGLNIRRVDVVSNDSGVSEPDQGIYKDTALGVQMGCYGVDRLVCADNDKVFAAVDAATAPDAHDVIVVVANSTRYGGSGGAVATMSMNVQAIELALHEIGHTAFKLADEYDYGTCDASTEPTEANVTTQLSRSNSKWGDLIAANVQVPTPTSYYAAGTVGLFQGARYCTSGMYRPTEDSRMRTLGQPWYAVNERRADTVFASYYDPSKDGGSGPVTLSGSVANQQWVNLPSGSAYTSNQGGTFTLDLSGPSNADFDLTLYKWDGANWSPVAVSNGPTSTEHISYQGGAGYYYFEVKSYSGAGNFSVTYRFPA